MQIFPHPHPPSVGRQFRFLLSLLTLKTHSRATVSRVHFMDTYVDVNVPFEYQ